MTYLKGEGDKLPLGGESNLCDMSLTVLYFLNVFSSNLLMLETK